MWLDNLLYEEELAHRGHGGYGERYFEGLGAAGGPAAEGPALEHAADEAGSYWYTRLDGRPAGPS